MTLANSTECEEECNKRSECNSFIWWPAKNKCELKKTLKDSDKHLTRSDEAHIYWKGQCVDSSQTEEIRKLNEQLAIA